MNHVRLLMFVVLAVVARDSRSETAYFLCSGWTDIFTGALSAHVTPQSFVVPVSDAEQIATLRNFLARRAQGLEPRSMVASVRLTLGGDGVNRNYAEPEAPAWGWRVAAVLSLSRLTGNAIDASFQPSRDSAPSDMERFLRGELGPFVFDLSLRPVPQPPPTDATLIYYPVQMELTPLAPAKLGNVSTRGFVGGGERVLIAGFVVEGGKPRNVIVRALGPSLRAFGVTEALADPRIEVFRGGVRVVENDSWIQGNLNVARTRGVDSALPASPLAPTDAREPAVQLSLEPGHYTAVVRGADNQSGIALLEVFDLDGSN